MAYTTKAKVENMLGITIPAGLNQTITDFITGVKIWIDLYCGKTFEGTSETRYYDGNGKTEILIDSFVSISELAILNSDGTTYDVLTEGQADDFVTTPYNRTEKNGIQLTGNGFWGTFSSRKRLLKVTGVFGYSTTCPMDVEIVATKLVGQLYKLREQGEGNLSSVRLGDYQAAFQTIDEKAKALGVYNILDNHRDIDI